MPFGIDICPLIFTLVATEVLKFLHCRGVLSFLHQRLAPLEPRLKHPDHKYKEGCLHPHSSQPHCEYKEIRAHSSATTNLSGSLLVGKKPHTPSQSCQHSQGKQFNSMLSFKAYNFQESHYRTPPRNS